jgi:alanine-glyoxylate transaminase/serine-glyoxylate transaminase/serine-pyruvate transaminase
VQSWFLDLNLVRNYWAGANRTYHHTAPVSAMFAIYEAYRLVLEEGLEQRWQRHLDNHNLLRDGLENLGLSFLVEKEFRLPMLNSVIIPDSVDDKFVRSALLNEYNIEIGAGLGEFAGKIWRIGLMGESSSQNNIALLLEALKDIFNR